MKKLLFLAIMIFAFAVTMSAQTKCRIITPDKERITVYFDFTVDYLVREDGSIVLINPENGAVVYRRVFEPGTIIECTESKRRIRKGGGTFVLP